MRDLSRRSFLAAAVAGGLARTARAGRRAARYQATRQSLNAYPLPDWFQDGKLGIVLHWGLYSVPGFAPKGRIEDVLKRDYAHAMVRNPYAEDYWNAMRDPTTPTSAFHRERYGDRPYEDFRRPFGEGLKAWDPDGWAAEFRNAGGHYVVLTAKYADGYCLWPTKHENPFIKGWSAAGRGCGSASISRAAWTGRGTRGRSGRLASTSRACRGATSPPIRRSSSAS